MFVADSLAVRAAEDGSARRRADRSGVGLGKKCALSAKGIQLGSEHFCCCFGDRVHEAKIRIASIIRDDQNDIGLGEQRLTGDTSQNYR